MCALTLVMFDSHTCSAHTVPDCVGVDGGLHACCIVADHPLSCAVPSPAEIIPLACMALITMNVAFFLEH